MPIEPGIIDANVLVYAVDADAPQHQSSRALLDAAQKGLATLYVTSQILCEFYSVVTNARRVVRPRSPADAVEAISGFAAFLHVLPTRARAVGLLVDLLRDHPGIGGDVFDLQLVSVMLANGVQRIYTFNTDDFKAFSELTAAIPPA